MTSWPLATHSWLCAHDRRIDLLSQAFPLFVGHHPTLPLAVLSYKSGTSKEAEDDIINECRGLVVEVEAPGSNVFVRIIAHGFRRFHNIELARAHAEFNFTSPFSVQTKEDGTYVILFCYTGRWMMATRCNFGEDTLAFAPEQTYESLVLQTLGGFTSWDALRRDVTLDARTTYVFELCALHNRIIQRYDEPTLFLLGLVVSEGEQNSRDELNPSVVDSVALQLRHAGLYVNRPRTWTCTDLKEAHALLDSYNKEDWSALRAAMDNGDSALGFREGFVLVDNQGRRLKLKSPWYKQLHCFKYRGWQSCTPRTVIPWVLDGLDTLIRRAWFVPDVTGRTMLNARFDDYRKRVTDSQAELHKMLMRVDDLTREQVRQTGTHAQLLFRLQRMPKEFRPASSQALATWLSTEARREFMTCLMRIYDQQGERTHRNQRYCRIALSLEECDGASGMSYGEEGLTDVRPQQVGTVDVPRWDVKCYCGAPMELVRLKTTKIIPRPCHCGFMRNSWVKSYPPGTWIYCCTRLGCELTMEAHQQDHERGSTILRRGQPLGIPASQPCKALRMALHDLMFKLPNAPFASDQDAGYQWLAEKLGRRRETTHMSHFDLLTCRKAIDAVQTLIETRQSI